MSVHFVYGPDSIRSTSVQDTILVAQIPYFQEMKRSYLSRVYAYNKKLFLFVSCFAGLTLLCNLRGYEITPFFVWGMYSQPEKARAHYEFVQTKLPDGTTLDPSSGYTDNTRFFLNGPLNWYVSIRDNGGIDPTCSLLETRLRRHRQCIAPLERHIFNNQAQQQAFPGWYLRYVEAVTGNTVRSLSLWKISAHYDDNQHIAIDSTNLFGIWSKP